MNSLEFNAVRSELQILEKNDFDLLRRDVARLQDEVTKLRLRMAEELRRVQSNVRLELSVEKGRVRDEQSAQEIKVKEADAKIESEIATIKTQIESIQWDLFKALFRKYYTLYCPTEDTPA
jgi:predicted  nucleic acid-binding Zn-ribbon protein